MPAARRIFLTGSTGFLGSHLTAALLGAGHQVVALARGASGLTAHERVLEMMSRVRAGTPGSDQLEVIEGDISTSRLGLDPTVFEGLGGRIDEIWHCAASLSFLEEDREQIFRMNVQGTRHVLDLAERVPGRRLHHVSTAYVAGDRSVFAEDDLDVGQGFRNPYEESKFEAERMLRSALEGGTACVTVYRPSVVVGEADSGRVTHFHGVYAFIRGLWAVARRIRRGSPASEPVELDLRIQGSASSTLNFVPIDFVTAAIIALADSTASAGRTYHLTNPIPTPNHLWLGILCDQIGIRGVRLVSPAEFAASPMTRLEKVFHRQMTFYAPYLLSEPTFDCTRTLEDLRPSRITCPEMTRNTAARITGWYIDLLNSGSAR
jgi:thioester reductase-like protein